MMQSGMADLTQLNLRDTAMLHACFMPFVQRGGLFIPSQQSVKMGEHIVVSTTLPGQTQLVQLAGKVIWISHKATGLKPKGFAIQLGGEKSEFYRLEIEKILGVAHLSDRPSFTL